MLLSSSSSREFYPALAASLHSIVESSVRMIISSATGVAISADGAGLRRKVGMFRPKTHVAHNSANTEE